MLDQNPQCGGESKERFLPLFKYISQWSSSPPSSSSSSSSLSNLSSHYTQTSSEKNRHVSFLLTFSCGARGRGKSIAHELLEHLISIFGIGPILSRVSHESNLLVLTLNLFDRKLLHQLWLYRRILDF
mmetsp:Transcript_11613/g.18607  ORF Transcript_11613/g.18607 Transcript_11613/m.18607 type:complete len:128 (+) Transcript_11613:160-543(+)